MGNLLFDSDKKLEGQAIHSNTKNAKYKDGNTDGIFGRNTYLIIIIFIV